MNALAGPCAKRRTRALVAALATLALALGTAGSAAAASSIEGVWSFNGGAIAVQPAANGTFTGTVVTETKFAECAHPVGQVIWTGMTPQPDGSYWGFHQWYFEKANCALNPTLGPTAWRVVEPTKLSRYLRVCLSNPGTTQPTIAATGASAATTYGCANSAAATSGTASFRLVSVPNTKRCLSLRRFQIHVRDPRNDAFTSVQITLRGRRLSAVRRGKYFVATVNLKGLPLGTFTIRINGTTVLGQHISVRRTYHTCVRKISPRASKPHRKH
jgi:hypothetical protein